MNKFTSVRQVRNVRGAMHLFQNRRTMWMMIRETWKGHYKMSLITIAVVVLGLLYVVSPFDLVTDFLPIIGWFDDGAIIYFVIKRLQKETQRYIRFKAMERRHN